MKRSGILCGLGTVLAITVFGVCLNLNSGRVGAQVADTTAIPQSPYGATTAQVAPTSNNVAASPVAAPAVPVVPARAEVNAASTSNNVAPASFSVVSPSSFVDRRKPETIDDLLSRLKAVKAQKAELEHAEQELVLALREKFKEQKHLFHSLGITLEETQATQGTPPPQAGSATLVPQSFGPGRLPGSGS